MLAAYACLGSPPSSFRRSVKVSWCESLSPCAAFARNNAEICGICKTGLHFSAAAERYFVAGHRAQRTHLTVFALLSFGPLERSLYALCLLTSIGCICYSVSTDWRAKYNRANKLCMINVLVAGVCGWMMPLTISTLCRFMLFAVGTCYSCADKCDCCTRKLTAAKATYQADFCTHTTSLVGGSCTHLATLVWYRTQTDMPMQHVKWLE